MVRAAPRSPPTCAPARRRPCRPARGRAGWPAVVDRARRGTGAAAPARTRRRDGQTPARRPRADVMAGFFAHVGFRATTRPVGEDRAMLRRRDPDLHAAPDPPAPWSGPGRRRDLPGARRRRGLPRRARRASSSRCTRSSAGRSARSRSRVSVNLALYGLTSPFAAALMERFGIRAVVTARCCWSSRRQRADGVHDGELAAGAVWGVLVGLGTGSMALALVATVTGRWFVTHRGLVSGVLTAGGAAGQLVFLPWSPRSTERRAGGWRRSRCRGRARRGAVRGVAAARPARPTSASPPTAGHPRTSRPSCASAPPGSRCGRCADAARTRPFWFLAGGFAICGATTNGLIQPHFVPAAHDHGMPITVGRGSARAGRDLRHRRHDRLGLAHRPGRPAAAAARLLRAARDLADGAAVAARRRPSHPSLLLFVVFYGLDWVATVPPTMALSASTSARARRSCSGGCSPSHQVGAAVMALVAGIIRDRLHTYDAAWYVGGALCLVAGALSLAVGRARTSRKAGLPA